MPAVYSKNSPFAYTPMAGKYLDLMVYRSIPKKATDTFYEIDSFYQYRPDIMASDLYGDPALWWVFSARNPSVLKDPIFDFYAGQRIYVPLKNNLFNDLGI